MIRRRFFLAILLVVLIGVACVTQATGQLPVLDKQVYLPLFQVTTTLNRPANLGAHCRLYTNWIVEWQDTNTQESGYEALLTIKGDYRGRSTRHVVGPNQTSFDFDLIPQNTFTVTVRAFLNGTGGTIYSDWAELTVEHPSLCAPGHPTPLAQ